MDPPPEPPKTPPNKFPNPPSPHEKTPPARISCDFNTRDAEGSFYVDIRNKTPDFEIPPLKRGDFKERPTLEEWADKLGYKLPSGETVLSGRPDPSELKSGAKLPPSIEEINRLLKKNEEDPMALTGRSSPLDPKLGAILKSAEGLGNMADTKDPKLSSEKSKESKVELGLMLPPPPRAPRGLQIKADKQTLEYASEKSNKTKQEVGSMPQRLLKGAARLQEMADMANPQQAEEDRAKVFMNHLPHVQAASRRLQGHLDIYGDETWPLPPLPNDHNPFIVETNAVKIRAALDDCKDFAVTTTRESDKSEFLDVVAKYGVKRAARQAGQAPEYRPTSLEDKKKANEAESSGAIARMMWEGLQEHLNEWEDEGESGKSGERITSHNADQPSEVPSTPKSLFHSVGPSPAPTDLQTSQGSIAVASEDEDMPAASQGESSVDTAERERREELVELLRDPCFLEMEPPENNEIPTTPDPHYDSEGNSIPYNASTASNDDREMHTPSYKDETAGAASEHIPATIAHPCGELEALSVRDSDVRATQSMIDEALAVLNAQDKGKGRETSPGVEETTSDSSKTQDKGKGKEASSSIGGDSSYASQNQQKGKGKQTIFDFGSAYTHDCEECQGKTGLGRAKLDVTASLRNHSVTFVDETQPKTKQRNPPVPEPENMPGTLTEAICNYIPLEAKSILTLTLERVDSPVPSPTDKRCILLKHFEVGLDGVEGLCQGTAKIPETPEVSAERERRVGKIGTLKQGDGGFYRSLKSAQQKEQRYGKGYWYFFGVKFWQTSREKKLRRGGKWFLFGAPIEAVYHLDVKRNQENVAVLLGGGVDKSDTEIKPFKANFKRTHTLFSRGGVAPMDIWPGGEDWDDGVFKDIRAAMANNGLRVGFLYADTQTSNSPPKSFPTVGKFQAEKKRKQSEPEMTEDEMKAMEKSMKPKKLSDELIGALLGMRIINDRAKQDAAARPN